MRVVAVLAAIAGASLAVAVGGCGGSKQSSASTPEFTVPTTATAPTTTNPVTTPTTTTVTPTTTDNGQTTTDSGNGNGGTTVPSGSSGGTPSGTTTTPEQAAQKFAQYCKQHPNACGD